MTSMEKKLTENRLTEVKAALSAKYRTVDLGGEKFFVATDGALFRVGVFPGEMALVIEYADTEQEARQNALEDGDRKRAADADTFAYPPVSPQPWDKGCGFVQYQRPQGPGVAEADAEGHDGLHAGEGAVGPHEVRFFCSSPER